MQVYYVSCPMLSVEEWNWLPLTCCLRIGKIFFIGTPKYLKVRLKSIIWSVAVLEATNFDPYVAVSTVACLFEYESMGVWFTKCKQKVRDLVVAKQ